MIGVSEMVEIKHLRQQGLNKTQVANRLDLHRNTVHKYWDSTVEEVMDDETRQSIADPYFPFIEHRLTNWPDLTASRLYREITTLNVPANDGSHLLPEKPYDGSKRTIRRVVAKLREEKESPRVYKPYETLPGEQFQVDWAGPWKLGSGEDQRKIWLFSFVLGYSRVQWGCFVDSTDMVNFLECHKQAFEYVGGVPRRGLYDNAKTVVSKRVGSVVEFNRDFLRFALNIGFHPDACWIGDPESKGKVEKSIDYAEKDFLYTQPLEEMELRELNEKFWRWLDEVANERIHQKTNQRPADRLAEERAALKPLPERTIPIFDSITRTVGTDSLIRFETNEYSVPHEYARKKVRVQVHRDHLEVYAGTEKIAEHRRVHDGGRLITEDGHWKDRPTGNRKRHSKRQAKFESIGEIAPSFLKNLARQRNGHLREQVDGILKLREDYTDEKIHEAMVRADGFGKYSYGTLKNILEARDQDPNGLPDDPRNPRRTGQYTGPNIVVQDRSPEVYGELAGVSER